MRKNLTIARSRFLLDGAAAVASGTLAAGLLGTPALAAGADINVGVLVPLTGGGAPYGPNMLKAMQMTADAVNAAGGPLGRKLVLHPEDSQTSPDAAVAAAQKLISLNHVSAILGTWSSAVTLAVIPIAAQAGIISMNTSGAPDITSPKNRPLVFRTQPTDHPYGVAMARYAKQIKARKVALLVLNNPYALSLRDSFLAEWKSAGMPEAVAVVYNPKASSYSGELQQALKDSPDLLIIAGYTPDASIIAKEWYSANSKARVMGPGFAFNDSFVKNVGADVVKGFLAVDGIPPIGKPGYKAFASTFKSATGVELADSFWAAQAHDQINLLALALEVAKSEKGSDLAEKMTTVSNPPGTEVYDFATGVKLLRAGKKINYQGASGPCDFNAEHNIVTDFAVWSLEGDKREQKAVYTAKDLGSSAT